MGKYLNNINFSISLTRMHKYTYTNMINYSLLLYINYQWSRLNGII